MPSPSRRAVVRVIAASTFAGLLAGAAGAQQPVPRASEVARDPALAKTIGAMLAAAKARNFKALSRHVGERIRLDFGGGNGRAELGRRLARNAALWDELVWVLEHGGRFQSDGSYWAPYTFSADIGNLDAFEAGVLIAKVKVYAAPRTNAPVVAELDRTVVKVIDWKRSARTPTPFYRRNDWMEIELSGRRKAWIPAKYVRAIVDYRAGFEKLRGVWTMTTFIAGD